MEIRKLDVCILTPTVSSKLHCKNIRRGHPTCCILKFPHAVQRRTHVMSRCRVQPLILIKSSIPVGILMEFGCDEWRVYDGQNRIVCSWFTGRWSLALTKSPARRFPDDLTPQPVANRHAAGVNMSIAFHLRPPSRTSLTFSSPSRPKFAVE